MIEYSKKIDFEYLNQTRKKRCSKKFAIIKKN